MIHPFRSADAAAASSLPVVTIDTPHPYPDHPDDHEHPPTPEPTPIRHLLIGTPEVVQHTIHRLHNLRYVEAGFWSPTIALPNQELILTVNPHEVMRILVRSLRVVG